MKLKFNVFLTLLLALIAQVTFAQDIAVSGTVTDQAGMPIPGVNVTVKGTKTGVQTDFDGNFKINAAKGQVLVFSFLGMKSVEMPASLNMKVKMADDSVQLEGVVVTALGITRDKKSLGYGTQKVSGDEVTRVPTTNFINNLSGKVSGLQIKTDNNFGGSTNVVIRGYKSINNNNQALFVIDGVVLNNDNSSDKPGRSDQKTGRFGYDYGNAASDINPADIESINVLKGAAATALYGSRAANGAIMITTKRGKEGTGFGVNFDSSISMGQYDKQTFATYQKTYGEGYFGNLFRTSRDYNGDGINDTGVRTGDDASFGPAFNPNLNVYQWDSFIPESPYYQTARPWVAAKNDPGTFFQTAFTSSNTIGFNGGNDKGAFNLSYTNLTSNGILPNSEQKKNSLIGNASYKLTDRLTATFMANYISTKTLGRNGTGYNGNIVANFRQWWPVNVDIKELRDIYFATGKNYTWNAALGGSTPTSGPNIGPAYWNNPYFERYESYQNDYRDRILGNTSLNYKLTKWLDITNRFSIDTYGEVQEERLANGSYGGNAFGTQFTNESSGYQKYHKNFSEFNYDLMANYNFDITEKLNLKGIVGLNIRREHTASTLNSTLGGLYVPKFYALSNTVNANAVTPEFEGNREVDGYYGSASLGYDDFFFVDGTYRYDVSSTLPKDNNKYGYYSVSSSLVFSNLMKVDWLSLGKVRFGYAQVGNDAPYYSVIDTYSKPAPFTSTIYSVNSTKANANLVPERTSSLEAGLELQFFQKRVGLDLSAYKTTTKNQIVDLPVSEATGVTREFKNVGKIENKGIEASLNLVPVKTENFTWDMTVNWAKNENKVLELDKANNIVNYQLGSYQGGVSVNATVGQPYGIIEGSDYEYLNGQRIVDPDTGKYKITSTNDKNLGSFLPQWNGGINNRFNYKNVSLSFLVDVQKGGKVFSLDRWYGEGTGIYSNTVATGNGTAIRTPVNGAGDAGGVVLPGVLPDGTPNNVRLDQSTGLDGYLGYLGAANSDYVYDASYIKLREATIGYTFSKKALNNTFQELYVGFSGSNLWIIQKNLPDADPESGLSSGNLQGFQSGPLPTVRTFAINLKAKF